MTNQTITEADLGDVEIVAQASGQKIGDQRWTMLSLYRTQDREHIAKPFIAEIVGETLVPGEQRRIRRDRFATVARALNWGAFDAKTALFNELRRKAIAWMEASARSHGLVGVGHGGTAGGSEQPTVRLYDDDRPELQGSEAVDDRGWNGGKDGSFFEALQWLYEGVADDLSDAVQRFVTDWCASAETIGSFGGGFYSAGGLIRPAEVFDVIDHEQEYGRPPWAETFVRAMPYFKRGSFHARNG